MFSLEKFVKVFALLFLLLVFTTNVFSHTEQDGHYPYEKDGVTYYNGDLIQPIIDILNSINYRNNAGTLITGADARWIGHRTRGSTHYHVFRYTRTEGGRSASTEETVPYTIFPYRNNKPVRTAGRHAHEFGGVYHVHFHHRHRTNPHCGPQVSNEHRWKGITIPGQPCGGYNPDITSSWITSNHVAMLRAIEETIPKAALQAVAQEEDPFLLAATEFFSNNTPPEIDLSGRQHQDIDETIPNQKFNDVKPPSPNRIGQNLPLVITKIVIKNNHIEELTVCNNFIGDIERPVKIYGRLQFQLQGNPVILQDEIEWDQLEIDEDYVDGKWKSDDCKSFKVEELLNGYFIRIGKDDPRSIHHHDKVLFFTKIADHGVFQNPDLFGPRIGKAYGLLTGLIIGDSMSSHILVDHGTT